MAKSGDFLMDLTGPKPSNAFQKLPRVHEIEYDGAKLAINPSAGGVEKKLFLEGEYEPDVRITIKNILAPGQVAFDIGAHIGHHTATMLQQVGPSGVVYAFEPAPNRFDAINKNFLDYPNVHVLQMGVSDVDSTELLNDAPRQSPFVATSPSDHTIEIKTTKISTFMKDQSIDIIDLMKIDIEGHECKAILGISPYIDRVRNIIVEIHSDFIKDRYGDASLDAMIDVLSSFPTVYDIKHSQAVKNSADKIRNRRRPQFLFSR